MCLCKCTFEHLAHAILVPTPFTSNKGLGEPAHMHWLARANAACIHIDTV